MIKQYDKCIMGLSAIPGVFYSFLFGATAPQWARASSFKNF
jgi:hypothetical protein